MSSHSIEVKKNYLVDFVLRDVFAAESNDFESGVLSNGISLLSIKTNKIFIKNMTELAKNASIQYVVSEL